MDKKSLAKIKKFAEHIAFNAGKILLDQKRSFSIKKIKDNLLDVATSADYASQDYLLNEISRNFPGHNVQSEEDENQRRKSSDFNWVIDPLDGSKEFIRNMGYYCVNVSLEYKGELIIGVVYQPELNRLYSTSIFEKSTLNNKEISVSKESSLKKSLVYISHTNNEMTEAEINRYFRFFQQSIPKVYRIRNSPWTIECLYNVAMGAAEGFVLMPIEKRNPKWWDVASGIILVTQSGGKITDLSGQNIVNQDLKNGIIASNVKIHAQLLELVKKANSS
ncbi:hypothetical protein M1328_02805 [Patescibacteria group bacterium]|nr:hypothetical protein [Patescibacteria group bacterium]